MGDERLASGDGAGDVGTYCRAVEAHLTQVNGGHLVRIVGPAFDLVRRWATDGVPLTIVRRAITRKAERHGRGAASRPLRIEFCDADVRAVFDEWRRAIGLPAVAPAPAGPDDVARATKRPSLAKHLDRVLDKLGAMTGRLDWPDGLRDGAEALRERVATLKRAAHGARGDARDRYLPDLAALDRELLALVRRHTPEAAWRELVAEAEADLAPYRGRLAAGDWARSVDVTAVRLLRDRYGLPTIELMS